MTSTSMDKLVRDIATIITLASRDEEYEYLYHVEGGIDKETILKTIMEIIRQRGLPLIKITEVWPSKGKPPTLCIPFGSRGSLWIYIGDGKITFKRTLREIDPEWL